VQFDGLVFYAKGMLLAQGTKTPTTLALTEGKTQQN